MLCLAVSVVSLTGAALLVDPINQQREALQITVHPDVLENMPPEIAFTQAALGSFRGLSVDVLWARVTNMKQEGKLYEARQLSEMITTLQPRFPQVWAFRAWDMAYNMSVMTHTPEERWMWVSSGVDLLREKGIPTNPFSIQLYKELAWIFIHKIGQFSDDMHWYYKRKLAEEWHRILDQPPAGSTEQVIDAFRPVAEMYEQYVDPDREDSEADPLQAFLDDHPEAEESVDRFRSLGFKMDVRLLKRLGFIRAVLRSADGAMVDRVLQRLDTGEHADELRHWLRRADIEQTRADLMNFLRARVLHKTYHMDPSFMLELMEEIGPLDWRHPASHGMYWTYLGDRVSEKLRHLDTKGLDLLNNYRQALHAAQALTHNGHVTFDPVSGYYSQLPDPRFIESYEKLLFETPDRVTTKYLQESAAPESFMAGHENFLIWSIRLSYFYGNKEKASELYARVREMYSGEGGDRMARYAQPLDEFVLSAVTEELGSLDDARSAVSNFVIQAIDEGLRNGRVELANRLFTQADRLHAWYDRKWEDPTPNAPRRRMGLPPFNQMVADAFQRYMLLPPGARNPLEKARVWNNAPGSLRRKVYDRIRTQLYEQAGTIGIDPERAFPEPEGMADYRRQRAAAGQPAETEQRQPQQLESRIERK